MANIDYTKVGWNTTTVLNPTNFNHMDDALKTVCDKMDNVGDEVLGYEITASAPDHQIINATNATNAIKDGAGNNIANQFSELNNKITVVQSNMFINTSATVLGTITTCGGTFTPSKNCWLIGWFKNSDDSTDAVVYINNVAIAWNVNAHATSFVFPIKAGQTVSTRNSNTGTYSLKFYEMI